MLTETECVDKRGYKEEKMRKTYGGADKSLARPGWKKQLKSRHFSSDAKIIAAAETWLDGQSSECFWVVCKS